MQSGAFRLPNGNTFITEAADARITEVDLNGNIVYTYEYPSNNAIIARAVNMLLNFSILHIYLVM